MTTNIQAHVDNARGTHRASVATNGAARASEHAMRGLVLHTDRVAEIQNTLRRGIALQFAVGAIESV